MIKGEITLSKSTWHTLYDILKSVEILISSRVNGLSFSNFAASLNKSIARKFYYCYKLLFINGTHVLKKAYSELKIEPFFLFVYYPNGDNNLLFCHTFLVIVKSCPNSRT